MNDTALDMLWAIKTSSANGKIGVDAYYRRKMGTETIHKMVFKVL